MPKACGSDTAATAMQTAVGESTYPVLSAFKWQQTYLAIAASPISPAQICAGQLSWIAIRLFTSGAAYLLVAGLLGTLTGPGVLLTLVVSVLTGLAFAAPVVAYSATIETEGQQFPSIFRFIVMPMTLFAGAFFPIEQLPAWLRPLAWVTPIWHGTEVGRDAAFGTLSWGPVLGHVAFLVAVTAIGAWFAVRNFRRRLAR